MCLCLAGWVSVSLSVAKRMNSTTPLESWDGPGGVEEKSGVEQERGAHNGIFNLLYHTYLYSWGAAAAVAVAAEEVGGAAVVYSHNSSRSSSKKQQQ